MRVEIAGWGLATPLGVDAAETWAALLAGRFINDHASVPLAPDENSRVAQLGLHVAREAIAAAGWSSVDFAEDGTALVVGTSKGPIVDWIDRGMGVSAMAFQLNDVARLGAFSLSPGTPGEGRGGGPMVAEKDGPHPNPPPEYRERGQNTDPCYGIAQIAADLAGGLGMGHGPRLTISAACASGLQALIRGAMLIESGESARVLVVGVESSVHPLFIGSFQRLGVLPKKGNRCRPFDTHRDGFLMSEAAAAVCLESSKSAGHARPRIDRVAMGGTGGHLTAGDPEGRLWRQLLARVIGDTPPDLVHAHATGTVVNDPIELAAIEAVLPPRPEHPILYSHKGALGHSLGAAGLVSVVINCLAHLHGRVPPNVGLVDPMPTTKVRLSENVIDQPIRRSIAAASGFGGPTAMIGLTTV